LPALRAFETRDKVKNFPEFRRARALGASSRPRVRLANFPKNGRAARASRLPSF
jgi:hypothetical protein